MRSSDRLSQVLIAIALAVAAWTLQQVIWLREEVAVMRTEIRLHIGKE